LFGPWFRDRASWWGWAVFLAVLFGLPLGGEDATALYAAHTGRGTEPTAPAREGWVIVGPSVTKQTLRYAAFRPLLRALGHAAVHPE